MVDSVRGTVETLPEVSIVVPVNNEADNVAPLMDEIAAVMSGRFDFEAIFVNDGSTDRTETALLQQLASRTWLRIVRHDVACGQSAALRSGTIAARAPIIVTLDGDGQNDPSFIPAAIGLLREGGERTGLVSSRRIGRRDTPSKRLQSRIANRIRAAVLHDGTPDTGSGLKAFPRAVFLALPYFDALHRFLPALVRREGLEVRQLDVIDRPRLHGKTHYGMWNRLWVGILDLAGVWWLIRRRRRIPHVSEVSPNAP
jgi:dolichol-phosphate mannosyltransferase